jgi:hypothetical protein
MTFVQSIKKKCEILTESALFSIRLDHSNMNLDFVENFEYIEWFSPFSPILLPLVCGVRC